MRPDESQKYCWNIGGVQVQKLDMPGGLSAYAGRQWQWQEMDSYRAVRDCQCGLRDTLLGHGLPEYMTTIAEADVEQAALGWLEGLRLGPTSRATFGL